MDIQITVEWGNLDFYEKHLGNLQFYFIVKYNSFYIYTLLEFSFF